VNTACPNKRSRNASYACCDNRMQQNKPAVNTACPIKRSRIASYACGDNRMQQQNNSPSRPTRAKPAVKTACFI